MSGRSECWEGVPTWVRVAWLLDRHVEKTKGSGSGTYRAEQDATGLRAWWAGLDPRREHALLLEAGSSWPVPVPVSGGSWRVPISWPV